MPEYAPCECGTWPTPSDAREGICRVCHDYRPAAWYERARQVTFGRCCEEGVPRVGVLPARWTCPKCLREWVHFEDEAEGGCYVQTSGGPWQGHKPAFDEDRKP